MLVSQFKEKKAEFDIYIQKLLKGEAHLSFSSFKNFMYSPYAFFEYKMFRPESKAMSEGSSFHMCVLENDKYNKLHSVFDDSNICDEIGGAKPRSTKKYKEWKSQFEIDNQGKILISKATHDNYCSMAEYLNENHLTSKFLSQIHTTEKSITTYIDGFKFVGYVDAVSDQFTIDLKKLSNVNDKKIQWLIKDDLYDYQGYIYTKALDLKQHFIIAISDKHDVNVVEISQERLNYCGERMAYFTQKFRECIESDSWMQGTNFFKETHLCI